ncbi:MAG: EamA family transporter [archaeon]|nr:EamA family transporter [archaeon]
MNIYIITFLTSVFLASVSQILLKKSALIEYDSFIKEYMNKLVIVAYIIFFFSTLVTMMSYKQVPLTLGVILESTGYVFVSVLSYIFLKETFTRKQLIGLCCILAGVIICNLQFF